MKYNKAAEELHSKLSAGDYAELCWEDKAKLCALENLICELQAEEDMLMKEGLQVYFDFEAEAELFGMQCRFFKDSAIIDDVLYSRKEAEKLLYKIIAEKQL